MKNLEKEGTPYTNGRSSYLSKNQVQYEIRTAPGMSKEQWREAEKGGEKAAVI